ncbi:MAG: hypothetical protein QOJ96_2767, partial [Alphaproteobacteria bacterium]|nr:hypothetical protein [Alphaproteobacteria bacterium]
MTTGTDSTGSGPLTTEQILREEAAAIHGEDKVRAATGANLNHTLNNLDSAALCLSGGGIRSAAFGLGVLQALALHPRAEGKGTAANSLESSLLAKFHYLSTVSGGGYIGSWLSAFRKRSDFPTVWRALTGRPSGPNVEPPPLAWLRSYSNYITAKLGLTSADTWTAVAQYVGNLLLNWLIILPVVCIPILVLKILAVLLDAVMLVRNWNPRHLFAVEDVCTINWQPYALFAVGGAACLIVALGFLTHSRPSRQLEDTKAERIGVDQTAFIWGFLIWSVLAAVALSQVVGSDPIGKLFVKLGSACNAISQDATGLLRPLFPLWQFLAAGALVGFVVYAAGWIVGWPRKRDVRDFALWSASGVVYGALVALGFYLYLIIPGADEKQAELAKFTDSPAMYLTFWAPWMLCSQVIALTIFVGLISYQKRFDADREWISRAAGWIIVAAIGWLVMTFLVFAGLLTLLQSGFAAKIGVFVGTYLVPIGALAGLVTALAGWSSVTKTKPGSKDVSS